ncbi:MAG: division/cell wall cluster transcriptional repressor MraZ [Clostridiales bacterium]|nr:division/cell wall cluster transcriptional repressor MraZ [Clostridiales bacterium]
MFVGEYQHALDPKSRLIIPAKFRERLGEKFILAKGLDSCIFVYPLNEWEKLVENAQKLPSTAADARRFARILFSSAVETDVDKQGRALITSSLRIHAKIDLENNKDVVVIGVSSRVEIWALAQWEAYSQESAKGYEELAENLTAWDFKI